MGHWPVSVEDSILCLIELVCYRFNMLQDQLTISTLSLAVNHMVLCQPMLTRCCLYPLPCQMKLEERKSHKKEQLRHENKRSSQTWTGKHKTDENGPLCRAAGIWFYLTSEKLNSMPKEEEQNSCLMCQAIANTLKANLKWYLETRPDRIVVFKFLDSNSLLTVDAYLTWMLIGPYMLIEAAQKQNLVDHNIYRGKKTKGIAKSVYFQTSLPKKSLIKLEYSIYKPMKYILDFTV